MPFTASYPALLEDPGVRERTALFKSNAAISSEGFVCLLQGEWAVLHKDTPNTLLTIGSIEATTCCILFLRASDGSSCACSHVDSEEMVPHLMQSLSPFFKSQKQALEVSLVGSFKQEGAGTTEELVRTLLSSLHALPVSLTLQVAAVLGAIESSAVLDLSTGELRKLNLISTGHPFEFERRAQCFLQNKACPVFEAFKDGVWMSPPIPSSGGGRGGGGERRGREDIFWGLDRGLCQSFLRMSDKELLHNTSTSPEHEASDYAEKMRGTLQFILKHM